MARALSHEIRNPLGGLRGAAQLLSRARSDCAEYTDIIIAEADRISGLVDRVLYDRQPQHALCNIHLLRELTFLHETTGQVWNQRMMDLLLASNKDCEAARQLGEKVLAQGQIEQILAAYQAIPRDGEGCHPEAVITTQQRGRVKQTTAFNPLHRMREHADEVLRFVSDLPVPFANNLGERAIRMSKVKQKISGCFRTLKGAKNFADIRSYIRCRNKGITSSMRFALPSAARPRSQRRAK